MRSPPISFRPTPVERAGLERLAQSRPGGISDVLRELIRDRLPEFAREGELIAELDERCTKVTIALSHSDAGPLAVVEKVAPKGASIEGIAAVEARRRGGEVAVELVGRGEFVGCRVLLLVAPVGRPVRFEVVPAELTPA